MGRNRQGGKQSQDRPAGVISGLWNRLVPGLVVTAGNTGLESESLIKEVVREQGLWAGGFGMKGSCCP